MPLSYGITQGILVVTVEGEYTPDEFREVGSAGVKDPSTPKPARVLLDAPGSSSLKDRSPQDLRATAAFFAALGDIHRVAILATDDLTFGLMRMGSSFSDNLGLETNVFRSRDEAMDWLGGG